MKYLLLLILLIGLVSGLDVDFDCPDEVLVGEEFGCNVEVFDGEGVYDLKVEVDSERDSVLRVWDSDKDDWISSYYYLVDFVEEDEDVMLKFVEDGDFDFVVKLRQDSFRESFEVGEIEARKPTAATDDGLQVTGHEEIEELVEGEVVSLEVESEIIYLGGEETSVNISDDWELVYYSKDAKVVDFLPYAFCIFLIFVIGVLLFMR